MTTITNQEQFFSNIANASWKKDFITSTGNVVTKGCNLGRIMYAMNYYASNDVEKAASAIADKVRDTLATSMPDQVTRVRIFTKMQSAVDNFQVLVDLENEKRADDEKISNVTLPFRFIKIADGLFALKEDLLVLTIKADDKPEAEDASTPAPTAKPEGSPEAENVAGTNAGSTPRKRMSAEERARREAIAFTGNKAL